MAIEAQDLLDSLDEINIEGGHWIRLQKKAAFKALVGVAQEDYSPDGKVISGKISPYQTDILGVLKKHAKVFAFEADELDDIQGMDSANITNFETKLLAKYKEFFTAGVDLRQLKEVFDAEKPKVTAEVVGAPEIDVLSNELKTLEEDSAWLKTKEEEIALARLALEASTKVVEEKIIVLTVLERFLSKLIGKPNKKERKKTREEISVTTKEREEAKKKQLEQEELVSPLTLEKQNKEKLISSKYGNKPLDQVIKEKKELLAKKTKELPQNAPSVVVLNDFDKILNQVISVEQDLLSSDLKTIIKNGEKYDEAIQKLRSFEKIKDNQLPDKVKSLLTTAFKPKTKIELSSGTAFKSNLVMSLSDEMDPWDISKCLDIPESFTELPVNLKSQNATGYEEPQAQGNSHVFVHVAPKLTDSPAECIVAKKEFKLPGNTEKLLVVLKQELDGAKVTNLTDRMSSLQQEDQIEVAMMQAKMLLDNYKPGYTNITIRIADAEMAARVHAALLVMKGDSAAKSCTIENKNLYSKVPGAMESVTGSFCKEMLGKDIYDDYKLKYRSEMIKHKNAMKFEFGKEKNLKEYKKPEGDKPGPTNCS